MKIKQRTEVNMVTSEITVIRFHQHHRITAFCERCGDATEHISLAQAASILTASESETKELLAIGRLHSTDARGECICTVSLARCLND